MAHSLFEALENGDVHLIGKFCKRFYIFCRKSELCSEWQSETHLAI